MELLTEQVAEAKSRSDLAAELDYEVKLADVYDRHLGNRARAVVRRTSRFSPGSRSTGLRSKRWSGSTNPEADHVAAARSLEALLRHLFWRRSPDALRGPLADEYRAAGDLRRGRAALWNAVSPSIRTTRRFAISFARSTKRAARGKSCRRSSRATRSSRRRWTTR